jgi:hypothetical protein
MYQKQQAGTQQAYRQVKLVLCVRLQPCEHELVEVEVLQQPPGEAAG